MDKVFLDTDVVLDFMLGREPFALEAARIFSLAERKKITACTSSLVFSNAYYILRKLATHTKVLSKLSQLSRLIVVADLSAACVHQALESDFGDFEDALQHFTAQSNKCTVILTRNVKDFKNSGLAVMHPDQYLKGTAE